MVNSYICSIDTQEEVGSVCGVQNSVALINNQSCIIIKALDVFTDITYRDK